MFWMKNGKIVTNEAGLFLDCEECPCDDAAPCTCPEDVPSSVTVSAGGAFDIGVECDGSDPGFPNGTPVLSKDPEACQWVSEDDLCWNGRQIHSVSLVLINPSPDPCYWELTVEMRNEFGEPVYWVGRKTTGATPLGDYTVDPGTSNATTPETITVE